MNAGTLMFNGQQFPITVEKDGSRTIRFGGRFGYESWRVNATLDLPIETQIEVLKNHFSAVMVENEDALGNRYSQDTGLRFYELFLCGEIEYLIEVDCDLQWSMVVGYRPLP